MNVAVAPLMSILLNCFIKKNLNVKNLYHPSPLVYVTQFPFPLECHFVDFFREFTSLPWNQTTFLGYIGELSLNFPIIAGYWVVNGTFLLLFIAICQHHQAFYKIFKHSVNKLNQIDNGSNHSSSRSLCDLMRFHLSIVE